MGTYVGNLCWQVTGKDTSLFCRIQPRIALIANMGDIFLTKKKTEVFWILFISC